MREPDTETARLVELAREAAAKAYCPYSKFHVGAALLAADGKVYTGCNVENASYGLTICAERNALTSAVADGARNFAALALVAGRDEPATPCGACLQVLVEFCPSDMPVHMAALHPGDSATHTLRLGEFMPHTFSLEPESDK